MKFLNSSFSFVSLISLSSGVENSERKEGKQINRKFILIDTEADAYHVA